MATSERLLRYPAVTGTVAAAGLLAVVVSASALLADDGAPADPRSQGDLSSWNAVYGPGAEPTQVFEAVGNSLVQAPDSMEPAVGPEEAVRAALEDGLRLDVQEAISPRVTLAVLTKDAMGQTGGEPQMSERLVWDLAFLDAPASIHGPMDADLPEVSPCDLHILVDAVTGVVIEGYQLGCSSQRP